MYELTLEQTEEVTGGLPPAVAIVAVAVVKSTVFRGAVAAVAGAVGAGVGDAIVEWLAS